MMALEGCRLGVRFRSWDSDAKACAFDVSERFVRPFNDLSAVGEFVKGLDAVTYEWENVPLELAKAVATRVPHFFPRPEILEIIQDRLLQKEYFSLRHKVKTSEFMGIQSLGDLEKAVQKFGRPCVVKTRRHGYDGKGQYWIEKTTDLRSALEYFGGAPVLVERCVPFDREVSLIATRSRRGQFVFYPLSESVHKNGILRTTLTPISRRAKKLQNDAEAVAKKIGNHLDYVGTFALEFFQVEGKLWLNEMAARVHNSGHWTLRGTRSSQFENHLRAGLGMPLGSAALLRPTLMVNLIGEAPPLSEMLKFENLEPFLYGKSPKPGRKTGHLLVTDSTPQKLKSVLKKLRKKFREF